MNTAIIGVLVGAALIGGPAVAWTRFQRTRQDVADAKAKLRTLEIRWWQDLGSLFAPVGLLVAAVLILATIALIAGGRQ